MLTVKAIYDGKKLKLLDSISIKKPTTVLITFLEDEPAPDISNEELLKITLDLIDE